MHRSKFSGISLQVCAFVAGIIFMNVIGLGNIFVESVSTSPSPVIGEYTDSGTTINASLISNSLITNQGGIAATDSDLFVTQRNDTVAEYTTSGVLVNPDLITMAGTITSIAASGSSLFVLSDNPTTLGWVVGKYTTSGPTVNASLDSNTGSQGPVSITTDGVDIFIWTDDVFGDNSIGEYTIGGDVVNASLIPSFSLIANADNDLAISGSDLFAVDAGTIAEFWTSGTTVNASLVSGLPGPNGGLVVSDGDLFVTQGDGTVGEYTTLGAAVNSALVSGLDYPWGIAIADVPEPASLSLLLLGGGMALGRQRRI